MKTIKRLMRRYFFAICYLFFLIAIQLILGCAHAPVTPVNLPDKPIKPEIKATVVNQGNVPIIGYDVPSWLRFYAWMAEKDAYEDKLLYRLKMQNEAAKKAWW